MGSSPDGGGRGRLLRWHCDEHDLRGGGVMGGTIVCDVTEPLPGRSAAEFAAALGARLGLRLVLVHVGGEGERGLEAIGRGLSHVAETRVAAGDHAEALARVAAEE